MESSRPSPRLLLLVNLVLWIASGTYLVSPIDLIPDILPLIGLADDLLGLLIALAITVYSVLAWRRGPSRRNDSTASMRVIDVSASPEG